MTRMAPLSALRPYAVSVRRTVDAEGLVAYHASRYSVPPEHVCVKVSVVAEGGRIFIRLGEVIIADHLPAAKPRRLRCWLCCC